VLTVESCALSTEEITITPTIPVVKTVRGLPRIMFWLPPDVVLADSQASCDIPLKEGTQSIKVKIKAACKQGGVTEGLQPIIPELSFRNSRFWNPRKVHLPTIWVCVFCIYVMTDKVICIVSMTNTMSPAADRRATALTVLTMIVMAISSSCKL